MGTGWRPSSSKPIRGWKSCSVPPTRLFGTATHRMGYDWLEEAAMRRWTPRRPHRPTMYLEAYVRTYLLRSRSRTACSNRTRTTRQ